MAYRRGFKTEAKTLAAELRGELGLSVYEPLSTPQLAEYLDIPVISLSQLVAADPEALGAADYFLRKASGAFSAATIFAGPMRTIIHNDGHHPVRQNSNVAHELAHAVLQHPAKPALDDRGCRDWNQDIEDEAQWLAGELLLPEPAALAIASGQWGSEEQAAAFFNVSLKLVQFRLNVTAARKRMRFARPARS